MAAVVLDPYTHESAWILDTATRILRHFREADCRVVFIVAGTTDEARQFLGPLTEQVLTLCDADRALVKAAELEQLPAFVHLTPAGVLAAKAEGWDPAAWREVAVALAKRMSWTYPSIPAADDPALRHRLDVEGPVDLLVGHPAPLDDDLADAATGRGRLLDDLGRTLVADVGVE